ncbi:MAG: Ppx/GppA phosphatase family protein [Rhizobiaceae bacterium]|nr:Ppx/GppA phosphatase family protein [Rhizobiaceae bacterium]
MRQKGFSIASLLRSRDQNDARGRLGQRQPVAIIDIGSNSVRQVVYEGQTRSPSVLHNEKVLCGLGKGVAKNGRMDDKAVERALMAIRRFMLLSKQLKVSETHILATAASREAENGPEFISSVEEICGENVNLLTGREEAKYAALGIAAGFYKPDGIAGDQGGGSTELVQVSSQGEWKGVTTPLGALRLQELSKGNANAARKIARKTLAELKVDWPGEQRTFYAIGGTWRSLIRLYMLEIGYPIDVIHGFSEKASKIKDFCDRVLDADSSEFEFIDEISKNRKPLLPYGAAVLAELIDHLGVKDIATSVVGLREGYLYSLLDEEVRNRDALIEATAELSLLRARAPAHSLELADWTDEAFDFLQLAETPNQKRWRHAACNLADIVWRSASDFRAEQTLGIINNAGFNSISHEGRAFLALVTFHRYQGLGSKKIPPPVAKLASEASEKNARILAAMFRMLYMFSAGEPGVLPELGITRTLSGTLVIHLPAKLADMAGEKPKQRVEQFARELGEDIEIIVAES